LVAPAEGAATLTAFTAAALARIVPQLAKVPRSWIICGGGARNHTMMRMLRENLAPATVEAALGWSADAIEARPSAFSPPAASRAYPATTGVPMPMTGGSS
jgi:anhydro-N-acetylmuramic acid kinase